MERRILRCGLASPLRWHHYSIATRRPISFPESSFPATNSQKTRDCGSNHFEVTKEITKFCSSAFTASMGMSEMVAPRVSRFWPLVKGNEDSGNEIARQQPGDPNGQLTFGLSNKKSQIERFSVECRKTKTKEIIQANHKDTDSAVNQSDLEAITSVADAKRGKTSASESRLGLVFWLDKKVARVCFQPIM